MKSVQIETKRKSILGKRWSIKSLISMSFILMVFLPSIVIFYLSYQQSKSLFLEQTSLKTQQTLQQVAFNMDQEAQQIKNTVQSVYLDEVVLMHADKLKSDPLEYKLHKTNLDRQLNSYFHYTPDVLSVIFFYKDGGMYSYKQESDSTERQLRSSLWYNRALADKGTILLSGAEENNWVDSEEKVVISAAIAMPEHRSTDVETIYFVYRGSLFTNLFLDQFKQLGTFIVFNENHHVMASNSDQYLLNWIDQPSYIYKTLLNESGQYLEEIEHETMFISYVKSQLAGWKIVHITPYKTVTEALSKLLQRALVSGVVVTGLFMLVSFYIARSISKPMQSLVRNMHTVRIGQLNTNIVPSGPLEVYQSGMKFKEMIQQINSLIRQKEEQEKSKLKAEIAALQSQINPHFLLNTLNTIKLMSMIKNVPNIEKVTDALMRLLASSFNRGGSMYRVDEELSNLEHYINIMHFRHGNSFELRWDIDDAIRPKGILKLLLQPIVENAIVHGLQDKGEHGIIWIRGRLLNRKLRFDIEDNGRGMDPELIANLLKSDDKKHSMFSGIGILNVHQRIQLNYGESYGLNIEVLKDKGTRVTLFLPVIDWEAELKEDLK